MEQLDREALIAFYEDHYWPNNAILVVAGDVTPDEVRTLAETHYGPIPANPDIEPRTRPQEPPQIADRRLVLRRRTRGQPVRGARLPRARARTRRSAPRRRADHAGRDPRRIGADRRPKPAIAGRGGTRALRRRLLRLDQLRCLQLQPRERACPRRFAAGGGGRSRPGIAEFLQDGIDPAQFERIKFQIEAAQIFEEDNLQGLARSYGVALTSGLTVEDVDEWPDVLAAVTIDEVMEEARRLFTDTSSVTGYLMQPSSQPEAAAASSAATRTAAAPTEPAAESEEELQ
jgi:zinc protease